MLTVNPETYATYETATRKTTRGTYAAIVFYTSGTGTRVVTSYTEHRTRGQARHYAESIAKAQADNHPFLN